VLGSLFRPFIFLKTPVPKDIQSPELDLFLSALEGRGEIFMAKVRVNTKEALSKILHGETEIPHDFTSRERTLIEYCQKTGTNISELTDDFDRETYTLIFYRLCFTIGHELLKQEDTEYARLLLEKILKK
jgi:hypothetical protein